MKDDAFGDDDTGATGRRQVLGHVVHEEHFAAFGFHRKAVVGADTSLGRHKRRIGQDDVRVFVPAFLAGESVVFEDVRVDKIVQVHVDQRETYHVGRDVVAFDVGCQSCFFVGRELTVSMVIGVVGKNVLVGGDEESGGAASRVEQRFVLFGIDDGDDEVDDMAWGAELARKAQYTAVAMMWQSTLSRPAQKRRILPNLPHNPLYRGKGMY